MQLEMFCNKTETTISIDGFANASIWWPSEIFNIDVRADFRHKPQTPFDSEWNGLREALLAQHTGDYQSFDFDGDLEVTVTRKFLYVDSETRRIVRESKRSRSYIVNRETDDLEDLFV